mgnify:CR=1 FL=1
MSFTAPVFTNAGKALQMRSLGGEPLVFTSIGLGDGQISSQALVELTGLINTKVSVPISYAKRSEKYFSIKGAFTNQAMESGFYWREIGVFAADPDYPDDRSKDILYCYQNAYGLAEYIASSGSEIIEKVIRINVLVGNAEQVSAVIDSSVVFLTQDDLNDALGEYYTKAVADKLFASSTHNHTSATAASAGFMSAADKDKLDGISDSADSVSIVPALTAGTKIGTITINGVAVDLYCQTNTDTKYSPGAGITISGTTISNSGVRSVASGSANGTISVNTGGTAANVAVKGLASAAYQAVQTAAGTVGLHRISSGTAAATTTNCPAGCWYGKHD